MTASKTVRSVLAHVKERRNAQRDHPLIKFFADESIPLEKRLFSWVECSAFWVMGFSEFCQNYLRYPAEEAAKCPQKKMLNDHADEDAKHFEWFLHDLQLLKMDKQMNFSDFLRLLFSPATLAQRHGTYALINCGIEHESPIMRFITVEIIEIFGNLFLKTLSSEAGKYEKEHGLTLKFLGPNHLAAEEGHLMAAPADPSLTEAALFKDRELSPEDYAKAEKLADFVTDSVIARWDNYYEANTK